MTGKQQARFHLRQGRMREDASWFERMADRLDEMQAEIGTAAEADRLSFDSYPRARQALTRAAADLGRAAEALRKQVDRIEDRMPS